MADRPVPPDQAQRDLILTGLDQTLLVEAAAGTGKTTCLTGRMVNLLLQRPEAHVAAVTFTRQAAAELKLRFHLALERALAGEPEPRRRAVLAQGQGAFIGTIHAFCGRLLRERPVEALAPPAFVELDQAEDERLRREAWRDFLAQTHARSDPLLAELREMGLSLADLKDGFLKLADYPDVADWPASAEPLPDLGPLKAELAAYGRHLAGLIPSLPRLTGEDRLIPRLRRVARMIGQADLGRPGEVFEILEEFKAVKAVPAFWPAKEVQAREESARWDQLRQTWAEPLLQTWRRKRHELALRALQPALAGYGEARRREGGLNFPDLLLQAAALLRDKPAVRAYFARRFSHVLVDEFQDTDPLQAEVLLLLTAVDPAETEWRRCRPRPGALFVVGDPKQSIYRFRRADMVVYHQVKELIQAGGGQVVLLQANFRSRSQVREWVNQTFGQVFPAQADAFSPAHVPLLAGRPDRPEDSGGPARLTTPRAARAKEVVVDFEADFIGRTIQAQVAAGARPGEFLILTRQKAHLSRYAKRLADLGLPHQVAGGSALAGVAELALLRAVLAALVESESEPALVAVLRGGLFGLSDVELYDFRQLGGRFHLAADPPAGLADATAARFGRAWALLRRYATWLRQLPAGAAVEKIWAELGLPALAATRPGGNLRAGSLAQALEVLRVKTAEACSLGGLLQELGRLADPEARLDGSPARWPEEPGVRVMNLHQAKGLEAERVFLADPTGRNDHRPVAIHVDRSGPRARGYLPLYRQRGYQVEVWAEPPDWPDKEALERRFQAAEEKRLLYVAATRAGQSLTVSQRSTYQNQNPWADLAPHLAGCPDLPDPGPARPAAATGGSLDAGEVEAAAPAIAARWAQVLLPSYAIRSARGLVGLDRPVAAAVGEHGTEWGVVIHLLLEAALTRPGSDLAALAEAALAEQGLSPDLAPEALAVVRSVQGSALWARAGQAEVRLAETPFLLELPDPASGRPTLVRGVIDLAFREPAGWVIVDYKTDRFTSGRRAELLARYGPQVRLYAQAWAGLTGQAVAEALLYFVHQDEALACWPD